MPETLAHHVASLAAQLAVHLPTDQAQALAQLLAALRAGQIDPTVAQERLASDERMLEAVHRLAARAVTLQIAGSALGVMFGKDADLRIATITIGDIARRTAAQTDQQVGAAADPDSTTYHAVFHLPPAARRLLSCQTPYPVEQLLVGRDRDLQVLAAHLALDAPVAPPPVVLTGPRGVGKRALVSAFAHRRRQAFPGGIFWIRAGQPEEIPLQVASCGGPGGLDIPGWDTLAFDAQIEAVYAAWQQPIVRLLVLEDVSDAALLDRWIPVGGGCRVIVTTLIWPEQRRTLALGRLTRTASLQLLLEGRAQSEGTTAAAVLANRTHATIANTICDELDDLPLAVTLASAAIGVHGQHIPLPIYLTRIAQLLHTHALDLRGLRSQMPDDEERTVGIAVLLTLELIRAQEVVGSVALDLLRRIALCAPVPLPGDLLPRLVDVTPESGAAWDHATSALRLLQQLGLLITVGEHVWMHMMVARLVRTLLPPIGDTSLAIERALIASAKALYHKQQLWDSLTIVPHMTQAARAMGERTDDQGATLLLNLGYLLQNCGDLQRARPVYERALAICSAVLGNDHAATVRILTNLGRLLQDQGNSTEAYSYYDRALAINERITGQDSPPTARILHRLGTLREAQGDFGAAHSYYERALAINERVFGTEHPDTASSMMTLGHVLQQQGDYDQARTLYEAALAVCDHVLGNLHPATARSLHGLGALCELQGDMGSAQQYYERALAIREQTLGPLHPDTARSLHTLGYLLHLQDDFDTAHAYYERALEIREKVLGAHHIDTASTLNNMGHLLEVQGDLLAAKRLYERAFRICIETLGSEHPNTVVIQTNLAEVQGRLHRG